MKKTVMAIALGSALVAGTVAQAQMLSGTIRTIDLNRSFNEFYKTVSAQGKLKETADGFNKEHEQMMADYKKQVEDLNKLREEQDKPELAPEVRDQKKKAVQEKIGDTQKLQRDIEDYRRTHAKMLEDQTARMRQTILKEITDVITKESRDRGYSLVLDKSGNTLNGVPGVVFAPESMDITSDILKIINKDKPQAAEAPKPAGTK
jgi:Skp family chaperone for outer membrane proteins